MQQLQSVNTNSFGPLTLSWAAESKHTIVTTVCAQKLVPDLEMGHQPLGILQPGAGGLYGDL